MTPFELPSLLSPFSLSPAEDTGVGGGIRYSHPPVCAGWCRETGGARDARAERDLGSLKKKICATHFERQELLSAIFSLAKGVGGFYPSHSWFSGQPGISLPARRSRGRVGEWGGNK